jgi:hypothetical protein
MIENKIESEILYMPVAGQTNFATGNKSYRIENIRSHYAFPKHQQCSVAYFAAQRRENDEDNFVRPLDDAVKKLGEKNKMLTIMYMFNTAYCVMREELPFIIYSTILKDR